MLILDTHVLVWMDQDSPRLGTKARKRIDRAHRLIVAGVQDHDATLLTADDGILSWKGSVQRVDARG